MLLLRYQVIIIRFRVRSKKRKLILIRREINHYVCSVQKQAHFKKHVYCSLNKRSACHFNSIQFNIRLINTFLIAQSARPRLNHVFLTSLPYVLVMSLRTWVWNNCWKKVCRMQFSNVVTPSTWQPIERQSLKWNFFCCLFTFSFKYQN